MIDPNRANSGDTSDRPPHAPNDRPKPPIDEVMERELWRRAAASMENAVVRSLDEPDLLILAAYVDGGCDEAQRAKAERLLTRSSEARSIVREAKLAGVEPAALRVVEPLDGDLVARAVALHPALREMESPAPATTPRRSDPTHEDRPSVLASIRDWLLPAGGWGLAAAASIALCLIGYQLGSGGASSAASTANGNGDAMLADFSLGYFDAAGSTADADEDAYWSFELVGEGSA